MKLSNRSFLLLLFLGILLTSCKSDNKSDAALIERAKGIHERVITIDTHCDFNVANFTDSLNYTTDVPGTQVDLPSMIEGGLDVPWLVVYTGQDTLSTEGYARAYENAMAKFEAIHRLCEEYAPDKIELAYTSDDVRRIQAAGKKAAMIGIENGYPVGLDISNVEKFYNLGGRYMSLSHNGHSQLCDSNTGEEDGIWLHNGVSDLGREVIKEMNRLGMMIDVSHPSDKSVEDMLELSKAPLIASHSSAQALCGHSRNLNDELLKRIAEGGGVVQTVAFTSYLNTEKDEARSKAIEELYKKKAKEMNVTWLSREEAMALPKDEQDKYYMTYLDITGKVKEEVKDDDSLPPPVSVEDLVDHIDYMVELIGIDHVGISSDFDGGGGIDGWQDAKETFNVTLELVRRGYLEDEIEKLWGGNLLRVLDECEAVAKKIQAEG